MKTNPFGGRLRAGLNAVAVIGGALLVTPTAHAQDVGKPVTIKLQNAPVQTVLRDLFQSVGKNFTLASGITGTITVDLNQVPFDTALSAVLAGTTPPLEASLDADIYHVQAAVPTPAGRLLTQSVTDGLRPDGSAGFIPQPSASDPHHAYRIPTAHADAASMSYFVAAAGQTGGPPLIVPAAPITQPQNPGSGFGNGNGFGNSFGSGFGNNNFGSNAFGSGRFGSIGFGSNGVPPVSPVPPITRPVL